MNYTQMPFSHLSASGFPSIVNVKKFVASFRKMSLLLVFLIIRSNLIFSQCPISNVTLLNQSDVNNFTANYPDCTIITGNLNVGPASGNSDIHDLSGLSSLLAISGQLNIKNNGQLTSLAGLNHIDHIDGPVYIFNNDQLGSISGLSSLLTINQGLLISYNDALTSLNGLILQSCNGVTLSHNAMLASIAGLSSLTHVGSGVIIDSNNSLASLTGLASINSATGSIEINNNNSLTNLGALGHLTSIYSLLVFGNNAVSSINFPVLESVGHIGIGGNNNLASIRFNALNSIGNGFNANGLTISSNNLLTEISFNALSSVNINGNIEFTSNNSLASIGTYGPLGNVGSIYIQNNPSLADLSGLQGLTSAYSMTISGNSSMVGFYGLHNLKKIQSSLSIGQNPSLVSCEGLNSLDSVGCLGIANNPNLLSFSGLGSLKKITSVTGCGLGIYGNNALVNFTGMHSLSRVNHFMIVENNANLHSFEGLSALSHVGIGGITVIDNPSLTNFNGLGALSTVGGTFLVQSNSNLSNFAGFNALTVGGTLFIYNNPSLVNLSGLEGTLSVGSLNVEGNTAMTTLEGFGSSNTVVSDFIAFSSNQTLSGCATPFVCDYLTRPNASAFFESNAFGCNTQVQVQSNCAGGNQCTWLGGNGNWNDATQWDCGTVPGVYDMVIINAGVITLPSNVSVSELTMNNGTIQGNYNISVSGNMNWHKGAINTSGSMTVGGLLSSVNPDPAAGTGNLSRNYGSLILNGGATLENPKMGVFNSATLSLPANTTLTIQSTSTANTTNLNASTGNLNILGEIIKNGPKPFSLFTTSLSLTNNVTVNQGTFGIGGNSTSTVSISGPTIYIASGATFRMNSGTAAVSNTTFTGSGTFDASVGTTNLGANNTFPSTIFTVSVASNGKININQPTTIRSLSTSSPGATLSVCSSSVLTITFGLTNYGTIKGFGSIQFMGSAFFTNNGIIAPGCSPGTLTIIIPNYTNNQLDVELEETSGNVSYDLLAINGNITLQNTLNVTEIAGNIPNGNYTILTATGTITGTFATTNLPAGYTVVYNTNSVVLVKAALPLELLTFTANALPKTNEIRWTTATERNVSYHLLERSPDGLGHWQEINRQPGAVKSNTARKYGYNDQRPLPIAYYRLRSIDMDGSEQVSPMAQVVRNDRQLAILSAYPIPVQDELTVVLTVPRESNVTLQLTDLLGRVVYRQAFAAEAGVNQQTIPMRTLPAGAYHIGLIDQQGVATIVNVVK